MSPEVLSYAMEEYVQALKHQVSVAEAFYFGRIAEGIEKMLQLPEDVRHKIDQLIWDGSGGQAIDPTDQSSRAVIVSAIMHSVEERMGIHEED